RHGADRAGAVHHLGHRAPSRHLADVLAEVADGRAAIDRDLALVGLVLAGDHPEQGGLAGAVGADQSDLLAAIERRRSFDEQDLPAVLLADIVETNHAGRTGKAVLLLRPGWFEGGGMTATPYSISGRTATSFIWTASRRPASSLAILRVAHLLQPVDGLAVQRFLHGDMGHGGRRRGAMPVPLAGREPPARAPAHPLDPPPPARP